MHLPEHSIPAFAQDNLWHLANKLRSRHQQFALSHVILAVKRESRYQASTIDIGSLHEQGGQDRPAYQLKMKGINAICLFLLTLQP